MVFALMWAVFGGVLQAQDFSGKTISDVQIRFRGPKTVDETLLRNNMSVAAGQKFSNEVLDEDIKNLYESGLVDDVRFLAEPSGEQIKLICEVVTRPALAGIGFVGNNLFSDRKLADVTKLDAGKSLSDSDVLTARRNIEDHYRGFGYPDVTVDHRMQETDRAGLADLIFIVQEGVRSEVRKIRFEGNTKFADVDLRREMETKQKGIFSFITKSGRIDSVELERDKERILDHYRSSGHLRAAITDVRREPVKDGRVDLVFTVYEGPSYKVSSIGFGPMTVFTPEEMMPALSMGVGDAYSAKKVRDDIRAIRSIYGSRGYADASVVPDTTTSEDPSVVSVVYRVTEGKPYRVGRVNIQGNVKTKDRVIRREVPMKPNDSFNSVDVDATRRRLQNLNYFGNVQVTGVPSAEAGYRDLNVLVEERRTGSIGVGAGFSSIDNIVGFINLEQTNFDISNPWGFTGGGQRFAANLRLGAERRDFSISLTEPWFLGRKLALGGELFYRDLLFLSDQYEQSEAGGSIFIRKAVGRRGFVRVAYSLEDIEIDVDSDVGPTSLFQGFDGDFLKSALEVEYVYDSRDSNTTPRRGGRARLGGAFSGGFLGGDVDTYRLSASGSYHWLLPRDVIINFNGAVNVVDTFSGDDEVPIFDRLFLGGARDLRGFDFRDVGPRDVGNPDATEDVFGGQTSAFISLEATFPLFENVRGAVFYDAGFVSIDPWDFAVDELHTDAGIGLRLNLPVGPLAVDYAFPLTFEDDLADDGAQFNFYLNYQF